MTTPTKIIKGAAVRRRRKNARKHGTGRKHRGETRRRVRKSWMAKGGGGEKKMRRESRIVHKGRNGRARRGGRTERDAE